MIVTEEEANGLWCPMGRMIAVSNLSRQMTPAHNLNASNGQRSACQGTSCMMWRFTDASHGYCGLAGMPTLTVARGSDKEAPSELIVS